MVPINAPCVRKVSGPEHARNTAATTADFISRARNLAQGVGNMAPLAWLS